MKSSCIEEVKQVTLDQKSHQFQRTSHLHDMPIRLEMCSIGSTGTQNR